MNHTLVVIDMQERFLPCQITYGDVIRGVVNQVQLAKKRNDDIIVVEFESSQVGKVNKTTSKEWPTASKINDLLIGYNKVHYVSKETNDGGAEVLKACHENKIPHGILRLCGVYASWCVRETAYSLASLLKTSQINLVEDAIADSSAMELNKHLSFQELMCKFKNVRVIR